MTVFDYVFLAVLGLSAAVGLWRGLVSEIMALVAWIAALVAAWQYGDVAATVALEGLIAEPAWRQIGGFALVFVLVLLLAAFLRFLLRELLKAAGLGATDRFFGALFGVARGLVIAWVVVLVGGMLGLSREPWWANAMFSPPLETAVIAAKPWLPDAVADRVRFR
ncbi:CvpA family protein [Azoarcus communis]|uniref:CvpA family protein n=1 Tax=Parazoarcus communis SWub3 = DSM 12120 TaxID=1121029 RepID=A0A323UVU4_9RHOO|nr:CvpA family protein [Parazoarcus communis]NMG46854.1 CvpA family protein [Parazoarcus communis]NMG69960.1 CvpA family protein [Parazoarcus communis SWub3 = DSM 12120]PZA16604.1 CvpA family protein [Azoarcus communis] [Parazoarcus communis SWub3 = DSM 12120]